MHYSTSKGCDLLLPGTDPLKPIYVQIAEWLEMEILSGNLKGEERIYSQYQLADMFNINPATAAKGLNLLLEQDLLYKKRGLGMFVSSHAREKIRQNRINHDLKRLARELVAEAERLGIGEDRVMEIIKEVKLKEWKEDV